MKTLRALIGRSYSITRAHSRNFILTYSDVPVFCSKNKNAVRREKTRLVTQQVRRLMSMAQELEQYEFTVITP